MYCILAALKHEVGGFLSRLSSVRKTKTSGCTVYRGNLGSIPVTVVRTGVGYGELDPVLFSGCSHVISTGYCGGLDSTLRPGDGVLSTGVVYVNACFIDRIAKKTTQPRGPRAQVRCPVVRVPDARAVESRIVSLLDGRRIRVLAGRTLTCERVVRTRDEKERLSRWFNAVSVDMEDFFRTAAALKAGKPVLCVRAVLDGPDDEVPLRRRALPSAGLVRLLENVPRAGRTISALLSEIISSGLLEHNAP